MTRDYNKQRRDDVPPFSRNQPSSRYGEERSTRPARPRLNRERVDRAWESGAPSNHADYRSRSHNGQPPRGNWRNNQESEYSSAQQRRPSYGNRQENDRRFERTPGGDRPSRSRSFGPGRGSNDRRFNDRRSYSDGPREPGARPGYRENARGFNGRPRFDERNPGQDYQRRDSEWHEQPSRDFDRNDRSPRNFERRDRPPREYDRDNRGPRNFERGSRPSRNDQRRDSQNPRWQSRPAAQRNRFARREPDFNERGPRYEQFEGDYEHFGTPEVQRHYDRSDRFQPQEEEPHVTRLPDGRVLKGSRPAQRRQEQFWTGISQDAEALVQRVESVETPSTEEETVKASRKPRTRAVARGKKADGTKKRTKAPTGGPIPRPSRKGFKWPTP